MQRIYKCIAGGGGWMAGTNRTRAHAPGAEPMRHPAACLSASRASRGADKAEGAAARPAERSDEPDERASTRRERRKRPRTEGKGARARFGSKTADPARYTPTKKDEAGRGRAHFARENRHCEDKNTSRTAALAAAAARREREAVRRLEGRRARPRGARALISTLRSG